MSIEFYTGRAESEYAHEMKARTQLVESLRQRFAGPDHFVAAVFDFSCGKDLDLAVFKRDGIIVVELKECASPIEAGENGDWRILDAQGESKSLKGGNYGNPFHQAKEYRYALMIEARGKPSQHTADPSISQRQYRM